MIYFIILHYFILYYIILYYIILYYIFPGRKLYDINAELCDINDQIFENINI